MQASGAPAKAPTMEDQADLINYLINSCRKLNGNIAAETWVKLDGRQVEDLERISQRLRRMSPHEARIKDLVTRR